MAQATDPRGVQWSVRRRRWYSLAGWEMTDPGDLGLGIVVTIAALVGVWWPFWFVAHWLGLRWRIVIKRDGDEVDEEWVRGWRRSQRRITEILESVAAGTLPQSPTAPA
ncbi:hypothetical protein [Mycobacterium sp. E3198]|uniref:hypothetical protein n=1 Tax=Mycobacterium sp. E3198 TaxID=1834143 RepID=UPI0007FE87A4|nr:hypothetical protein [Mycobacterium sp. E3198]OBG28082.1 hypothetical protein A5673_05715 [Mycobacterium sp. E3198]